MKQVKRRVWSILLACVMLLTMLPAGAWAADEAQEVGTAAELIKAFSAGGEIRLKNDITVNNADTFYPLTLVKDVSATLDLNQHTLTMNNNGMVDDTAYVKKIPHLFSVYRDHQCRCPYRRERND